MEIERKKMEYFAEVQANANTRKLNVQAGEQLPERIIGPHTIASFTTEWRAYPFTIWHTFRPDGLPSSLYDAGWLPEMERDFDKGDIDPTHLDGLYHGPSRGHVQQEYAQLIGLPQGLRLRGLHGRLDYWITSATGAASGATSSTASSPTARRP